MSLEQFEKLKKLANFGVTQINEKDLSQIDGGLFGFGPSWVGIRIWNRYALEKNLYGEMA